MLLKNPRTVPPRFVFTTGSAPLHKPKATTDLYEVIENQVQAIEDEERTKRQKVANREAAGTKVWSEKKIML